MKSFPKILHFFLGIIVFLGVGELMMLLDAKVFSSSGSKIRLENVQRQSALLDEVHSGQFAPLEDQVRVMLLGDSIIYGAGVPFENTLSRVLESTLRASSTRLSNAVVLNVSRPGNNTYRNRLDFDKYLESFKPTLVVLGYNLNDVYGQQSSAAPAKPSPEADGTTGEAAPAPAAAPKANPDARLERVRDLRRILHSSRVLLWLSTKLNMELKLRGIVLKGSEFHHLLRVSHQPEYEPWKKSQEHLQHLIETCQQRGISFVCYQVPELNMIDHYSVFSNAESFVQEYFTSKGVPLVRGVEPFLGKGYDYRTLAISRYDGHPNAKAHRIMAEHLASHLAQERLLQPLPTAR